MWKYLLVVFVLVALCHVEARRGRRPGGRRGGGGRGGGGGIPPEATNVNQWVRVLPGNMAVQESAYSLGDQVFVLSKDKAALRNTTFKPSKTVYDFTAGSPPMAMLKVKKKCFLMTVDDSLTKDTLLAQIASYNGQRREQSSTVQLYSTDLTQTQTQSLQGRSALSAICNSRKPITALTDTQPASDGGRTKVLKVSTLDSFLDITITKTKGRGGRGGRGGRRGRQRGNRGARRGSRQQ
ncbi:uncharacterized protein LOC143274970 [Babylonia areolata]|uniref:uncharacterized protein LOC143274970 n=1 Tax=Babylonia areolata TaxID=304850 RepID=UPI003FD3A76C